MKSFFEQTLGCPREITRWSSLITRLTTALVGILAYVLIGAPGQGFSAVLPAPYNLTLAWNPSSSPGITGCRLYYGTVSGNYTGVIEVGNVTGIVVPGLLSGVTYYFAITAVDANGLESGYSNEINYSQVTSVTSLQIIPAAGGQYLLTVTGPAGHTNNIEATQDLKTWAVIGTVTAGAGGSVNFTDTNAASFSQRFYRTSDAQP